MSTLHVTGPVSRRDRRCDCCGGRIRAGERYRLWSGTSDMWAGIADEHRCASCCRRYATPIPGEPSNQVSPGLASWRRGL